MQKNRGVDELQLQALWVSNSMRIRQLMKPILHTDHTDHSDILAFPSWRPSLVAPWMGSPGSRMGQKYIAPTRWCNTWMGSLVIRCLTWAHLRELIGLPGLLTPILWFCFFHSPWLSSSSGSSWQSSWLTQPWSPALAWTLTRGCERVMLKSGGYID